MLRYVLRATLATALMLGVSTLAVAQYGGGGGMGGGGMPGAVSAVRRVRGAFQKGAIIGGIAGGAAAGVGLLYWSSTIEPSCKAAWPAMETGSSMRRTIKPTVSQASKMSL
jgi:hypothetical protein